MKQNKFILSAMLIAISFIMIKCNPHNNSTSGSSTPFTGSNILVCNYNLVDSSNPGGLSKAKLMSVKVTIPNIVPKTKTAIPYNFSFSNVGSLPITAHIEMLTHTIAGGDKTTTFDDDITSSGVDSTDLGNGNNLYFRGMEIHIVPDPNLPGKFKSTCNMLPPGGMDSFTADDKKK